MHIGKEKMLTKKIIFITVLIFLGCLLALYFYHALNRSSMMCFSLSLMIVAVAGIICAAAGFAVKKTLETEIRYSYRLMLFGSSAACFSWVIVNAISLSVLREGNRQGWNVYPSLWFLIPTAAFGLSTFVLALRQNSKWRTIKGTVESLSVALLSVLLIWIVQFNRNNTAFDTLNADGVLILSPIIVDVYILVQLVLLLVSVDKKKLSPCLYLSGIGYFIYALTNIVCYMFAFNNYTGGVYVVGGCYALSFAVVAVGALYKMMCCKVSASPITFKDFNTANRWVYLLIFPVVTMMFHGVSIINLYIYAVVIGLYHVSMRYINMAEINEKLLQKEKRTNALLEQRLEQQLSELTELTDCDNITKLYNRRYFTAYLEKMVRRLRKNEIVAVLQLDVDRFKTINDTFGHFFGDRVIIEISNRLQAWNSYGAVLARLGGDEFAILLRGLYTRYDIGEYCKQIIERCSAPIFIDDQVLYITISIGISLYPNDTDDCVTLLKNCDISMYKAKAEGFNKHVFYLPAFIEKISRQNEIEALLRKADLEQDFELVFQPQFDLPSRRLIGAEALLRWNSAEHGYIPPSVFVPIAEEINYIGRIGAWVITKAVEQIMLWNNDYGLELKMGVNISPKQLSEKDFFLTLKKLITQSGLNTSWLDAEITENLMVEEKSKVKHIFTFFEEMNISVSIDDFGSGYSSLGYLNKFYFDRIKIDKSLIDNLLLPDGSGIEVVKAILNMASAVGKQTIVEGVEKREQMRILEELGCQQVQGFLFGRPVSAHDFEEIFIKGECARLASLAASDEAKGIF